MFGNAKTTVLICSLAMVVGVALSGGAQEKEVVAVVNGVEITKDEFVRKLMILTGKPILNQMIDEILIQQKAKEEKVKVKKKEIDAKIEKVQERFPTEELFAQQLSRSGMTVEKLRQQFESQLLMEKLISKEIVITDQEIKDYFEKNKAEFTKQEEIRASHILVRTEKEAKEILKQLEEGVDFAKLAKERSTDSGTKDKGGDLGFFARGMMTPAFEREAFALKVGEISGVVKSPYGYHIIKVEKKKPTEKVSLKSTKEEIEKTLVQQKIWTKRSTWLQDLKKEAQIEIRIPELRD